MCVKFEDFLNFSYGILSKMNSERDQPLSQLPTYYEKEFNKM